MPPKLRSESRSTGDVAAVSPAFSGDEVRGSPCEDFESYVRKTLETLVVGQKQLESRLASSIEFNSQRIGELEEAKANLERKVRELETEVKSLQNEVVKQHVSINKQERFSRRNNLRIVGMEKTLNENCVEKVEKLLREKFGWDGDIKIERAHRDGKPVNGKPPHVLVKMLSYRDKLKIMKESREALKGIPVFVTDDLTAMDLMEKKKWKGKVKELYDSGTKLRFFAGKWRSGNGAIYTF